MEKFNFKGLYGCESSCGITRYGDNIFVLSYTDDDVGTSVTNGWEYIVTDIADRYGVDVNECIFIECAPHDKRFPYSRVTFGGGPQWMCNREVIVSKVK